MEVQKQHWDIFCRIVDNYGDIGVCWRLARQLTSEYGLCVRLWVDDLAVARRLIAGLDVALARQTIAGVAIHHWQANFTQTDVANVVIEAFGCDLPAAYLAAMEKRPPVWINLEYLSAETWVQDCHLRASPQPNLGLSKTFFFPGFSTHTGGLLREQSLLPRRAAFQQDPATQQDFWRKLGLQANYDLKISLFCYPNAPVSQLFDHLVQGEQTALVLIAEGSAMAGIADWFGRPALMAGDSCQCGKLTVHVIPFLSQDDFDRLLWACDLNFVRGEDSWVRAIWAGKPMIWQPYVQSEDSHLQKLAAYLDIACANLPEQNQQLLRACHLNWSSQRFSQVDWQAYLARLDTLCLQAQQLAEKLASDPDMAAKLVIFCENYF